MALGACPLADALPAALGPRARELEAVSDLRDWLGGEGESHADDLPDEGDVIVQLAALGDERRRRHDPRWEPPASWGGDPENLERLVREKVAKGWRF